MTNKFRFQYVPKKLTRKDQKKQTNMIRKSRRLYKKGIFFPRKKVLSFTSKKSPHILKAMKLYHVDKIGPTEELARKSGCSQEALAEIIRKGKGAYFSSGSRPNQTPESWGTARLASALTSGKAAAVDYSILEKGCHARSKALLLAKRSKKIKHRLG
jgi:hypothetical protein